MSEEEAAAAPAAEEEAGEAEESAEPQGQEAEAEAGEAPPEGEGEVAGEGEEGEAPPEGDEAAEDDGGEETEVGEEDEGGEEGDAEVPRASVPAERPSVVEELDEIDDPRKSVGVEVVKSARGEPEEEVLEEVRSEGYLWEGPCESSSASSASGEESSEWEEEEEEEFPREEYIQMYKTLFFEKIKLGKKNIILQKQMHEYCKKRKLDVYFEEIETPDPKLEAKYTRQLTAFEEFVEFEKNKHVTLKEELQKLELDKIEAEQDLDRTIEELIAIEKHTGSGLISASSGKALGEKTVDKLLIKQRKTIQDIYETRLRYIKLRDTLAGKEAILKKLETLGEGLHLLDYEQLRMENQSYSDKIEERDEELTRLRNSATSSIQILAHIREKANSTSLSIDDLYDDLEFVEMEANRAREYTGDLKKQRDALRAKLVQMRKEAGLLVHQRLLRDFERRIDESQALAVEIENLKNDFSDQNKRLSRVRDSINSMRRTELESLRSYQHSILTYGMAQRRGAFSKAATGAGEDRVTLEKIKKGSPFFPTGKLSRIVKYVSKDGRSKMTRSLAKEGN